MRPQYLLQIVRGYWGAVENGIHCVRDWAATSALAGSGFVATENDPFQMTSEGAQWTVTEASLTGPGGQSLALLPGHVAYWFAWQSYKAGKPGRTAARK